MAQIDIRHAEVLFVDGRLLSGAVNQPGGYQAGSTTMIVDGLSSPIANASGFQISGLGNYTIVSTVGGNTPTSITFTPALTGFAADNLDLFFTLTQGAVNDGAGGTIGAGSIAVDGISQAIPIGSLLFFNNHGTTYTVSGSTGGSTPTALTFTPNLTANVPDDTTLSFQLLGKVNKPGTAQPQNGNTTVTVDGFAVAIPNGSPLRFSGSTGSYTVVSTTGGSTPTTITFTPPLSTAAGLPADNGLVTIGGNVLYISLGEGNLTFEEKRAINYVRERKSIDRGFVMTGDDEPIDISLDMIWQNLASDTGEPPTPEEALTHTGNAAAWITSGEDPCEPYAIDIEILYTPPCDGAKAERILLREYRYESISHDLKAGTMSTKGKCKILLTESTRETPPIGP